jgi:hypothetical protein
MRTKINRQNAPSSSSENRYLAYLDTFTMNDLNSVKNLPSVTKAIARLRSLTDRPLQIKHVDEWVPTDPTDPPQLPSAAYVRWDDRDEVYVTDVLPEHMLVHELLHPILWAEGYPDLILSNRQGLRYTKQHEDQFRGRIDGIKDSLEHHEVHRRMREVYDLDMAPYYEHKARVHSRQLEAIVKNVSREIPFVIQIEIVDVLEMHSYRSYFGPAFDAYQRVTPAAVRAAEELSFKIRESGFATPVMARATYETVRKYLVAWGSRVGMNEAENDLWRGLDFPLVATRKDAANGA